MMLTGCQSLGYKGIQSDHFDGKRFHFPGEPARAQTFAYNLYVLAKALNLNFWPMNRKNPPMQRSTHRHFPGVRFINHATILIETGHTNILTDPIYSYRPSPLPLLGPGRRRKPGLPFKQLPRIDVVLISHNHYDHLDLPTLKRLERNFHPLFIVPLGNKHLLDANRLNNVIELDWWQSHKVNEVKITMLPAQHSSQRTVLDSNRTLWASYGIKFSDKRYFFAGDTGYNQHFKQIRKRWGKPDLAMLPIGSYEPRRLLLKEHLNPSDAVQAHLDLEAKRSFAIHWLTFQLSSVYPKTVAEAFYLARKKKGIGDSQFFILFNGQVVSSP